MARQDRLAPRLGAHLSAYKLKWTTHQHTGLTAGQSQENLQIRELRRSSEQGHRQCPKPRAVGRKVRSVAGSGPGVSPRRSSPGYPRLAGLRLAILAGSALGAAGVRVAELSAASFSAVSRLHDREDRVHRSTRAIPCDAQPPADYFEGNISTAGRTTGLAGIMEEIEEIDDEPIDNDPQGGWSDPVELGKIVPLLFLVGIVIASYAFQAHAQAKYIAGCAAGLVLLGGATAAVRTFRYLGKIDRERLAELRADSLPKRAKRAARALQEATKLVEELQAELTARTALLEDIKGQVANAAERATDMERLSEVDDQTTKILNKYFDEALKRRLEELEQGARKREWFIGTVIAVAVGVTAILFSHFVLGF